MLLLVLVVESPVLLLVSVVEFLVLLLVLVVESLVLLLVLVAYHVLQHELQGLLLLFLVHLQLLHLLLGLVHK